MRAWLEATSFRLAITFFPLAAFINGEVGWARLGAARLGAATAPSQDCDRKSANGLRR